jgi:hypothetical protein
MIRIGCRFRRLECIVAQPHRFVNLAWPQVVRRGLFAVVLLFHGCLVRSIAQDEIPATEFYRQALDTLGPESRIHWSEVGETSLRRWEPGRTIELRGVLIEWEPDRLVLARRDGNAPSTFPGDLVVGIEPGWKDEAFANVHDMFTKRRFADVIREGQAVLKLPSIPRWQQRLIVAEMVQSASALGQWQVAGKIYGYLAQDPAPQLLRSAIPLPWSDELLDSGKGVRDMAVSWIQSEQSEMQLLGASWLIGSDQNAAAIERLRRLAEQEDPMISQYAKVQLWRTVPPSEIESVHFGKWVALRDSLPLALQAGPTMLLGHRLDQAGATDLAIAEWLRIASFHRDRYDLQVRAIARAAAAARAAGEGDEAERIIGKYSYDEQTPDNHSRVPRGKR